MELSIQTYIQKNFPRVIGIGVGVGVDALHTAMATVGMIVGVTGKVAVVCKKAVQRAKNNEAAYRSIDEFRKKVENGESFMSTIGAYSQCLARIKRMPSSHQQKCLRYVNAINTVRQLTVNLTLRMILLNIYNKDSEFHMVLLENLKDGNVAMQEQIRALNRLSPRRGRLDMLMAQPELADCKNWFREHCRELTTIFISESMERFRLRNCWNQGHGSRVYPCLNSVRHSESTCVIRFIDRDTNATSSIGTVGL